jgi:hypothetical protein
VGNENDNIIISGLQEAQHEHGHEKREGNRKGKSDKRITESKARQKEAIIGASRWQPGAVPSTASAKVGILRVIVHHLCIAMHGPALGRFVSIFADTSYARGGRARVRVSYG